MGIKGLFPFLSDAAPLAIKETKMEAMTGRTIAIDASTCLYQFLVAVRQGEAQANLSNEAGEVTSHIQGFLSRTIKLLELGVKPVYVFDGKPPELKKETLSGRAEKKAEAEVEYAAALESGDAEEIRKASHRTARATPQMNADVQELLALLGCPVILAPSEAEASCAALCKAGKVFATATEDMDCLTFGSDVMLKNLFDTESSRTSTKKPVYEVRLATVLEQLDVPMALFVDFCILCGCDYCGTIKGVGPSTAFKLLKTHGSLEAAVAALDAAKRPDLSDGSWPVAEVRGLFAEPEVVDAAQASLRWSSPDFAGLTAFLVGKHSFNEQRVAKYVERLKAVRAAGTQSRLDGFFKLSPGKGVPVAEKYDPFKKKEKKASAAAASSSASGKRAAPPKAAAGGKKAKR